MNREDQELIGKIVQKANERGYIDTQELCFILAEDQNYDVNGLMRVLGIDTRFFPKQKGQTLYRERVGKWHYIIQKLFLQKSPPHLHEYSSTKGWRPIGEDERSKKNTPHEFPKLTDLKNVKYASFKLTDLEKWFSDVLKQPFPGRLITKDTETHGQGKKKKKGLDPKLFEKYICLASEFMSKGKERTGQVPLKAELEDHLQALLQKNKEALGVRAFLPDAIFRKIWSTIPNELRRDIGERTKPSRK